MLDLQYEYFLIGILSSFISGRKVASGSRFHYPFPDPADSKNLHRALIEKSSKFLQFEETRLPYLEINNSRLIFVRHCDGASGFGNDISFSESYISMLRDKVASQSGLFSGTSLLILHNTLLDTLLGTSEDLSLSIWSHSEISNRIEEKSDAILKNKPIIKSILRLQSQLLMDEGSSIFGYRDLFDCISSGKRIDLKPLGFFDDRELLENWTGNPNQSERRLRDNRNLKEKIEEVLHHYPTEVVERLPEFGEKFVRKHIDPEGENNDWIDLDFSVFDAERKKQLDDVLVFSDVTAEFGLEIVGPRTKGDSLAQRRDMHMICLMRDWLEEQDLTFEFETEKADLTSSQVRINQKTNTLKFGKNISSRRKGLIQLKVSISKFCGRPEFFSIKLDRPNSKECYAFNILLLQDGLYNIDALKNSFLVLPNKAQLALQTQDTELELSPELSNGYTLGRNGETIDANAFGSLCYADLYENSDSLEFTLKSGERELVISIEGELHSETFKLPLLVDQTRLGRLFRDDYNGVFIRAKGRVVLDNTECRLTPLRKTLLEREYDIINGKYPLDANRQNFFEYLEEEFPRIGESYRNLLAYFRTKKTCPSLASWGDTMRELVGKVVSAYEEELSEIPKESPLSRSHRELVEFGFASFDGTQFITPFHPLVLGYYLHLANSITGDESLSFKRLPPVTLKRLNPKGFIPFVFLKENEFAYTQVCEDNMFWLEIVPRQENSYDFVERLVSEKIDEIVQTFPSLFKGDDKSLLILNSFNNGENEEVFKGVLAFLQKQKARQQAVHVNIYGAGDFVTEFEKFGEMSSYEEIKERYSLSRDEGDHVIDLLRNRLSFSKFTGDDVEEDDFDWCHIAFYKNNEKVSTVPHDLTQHKSGVSADGLLGGETSTKREGNHYTAIGLKNVDVEGKPHLRIARLVNNLLRPGRQSNEHYRDSSALQLSVSSGFRTQLEKCYRSSLWTTVIDPKVTLSFFEGDGDVVLIHYSDQYTNSAGYDAITVTGHVDLYNRLLSNSGKHLLGEFNSFNGEWLLKMVSSSEKTKLERRGIIAAWKTVYGLLRESGITWIPLSVAEMIRVSGNIGLKITESDFARYHKNDQFKGKMSDDILFVGLDGKNVYLLPVEVKTGEHPSGSLSKAKEQVKALREYLVSGLLEPDTLEGKIYRGLFIRQLLMQLEKFELYRVFGEKLSEDCIANREDLLAGNYEIAELPRYAQGLVVGILSNPSCISTSCTSVDGLLELKIPQGLLSSLLETPLPELADKIHERVFLNLPERAYLTPEKLLVGLTFEENPGFESGNVEQEKSFPDSNTSKEIPQQSNDTVVVKSGDPLVIKFGYNVLDHSDIFWEPTNTAKVFNTNTAIIGTMGTGKTQFTKSLIAQLHRNQAKNICSEPIGILIFDYKADYVKEDFIEATGAAIYELCDLPFNPFSLFGEKPMLPVHTANLFRSTMGKAYGLGVKQQNKIRSLVSEAYERNGIYSNDRSTWKRSAPTLNDVWNVLHQQEKVEEDSLYAALSDLIDFQIFEKDSSKTRSLNEFVSGVTVINLSGYDPQIQNLVVAITLDLFYSQMHIAGSSQLEGNYRQISKMILVDEADNFMSQGFESLKKILKEGREFGVGTILSTQELTHFKVSGEDYSSYFLTWVIHRVSQIKGQDIQSIFNPNNKQEQDAFMQQIRELDKHYSLYVDGEKRVSKMKDLAFWQL